MKQAFSFMGEGTDHPAAVLRKMTALGMRSKNGRIMKVDHFIKMLQNVVYIGLVPSKKYGIQKGLHEPLVSEPLFRRVQLILKGKRPVAAPIQRNRPEFPLRRFLRCVRCETPLTGGSCTSESGRAYLYYWCPKCRGVRSIPVGKAEEEFIALLRQLRPSPAFTDEFLGFLKEEWEKTAGDSTMMAGNLQRDLKALEAQHRNLLQKYVNNDPVILPYFDELRRHNEERIACLRDQIEDANAAKATFEELLAFSQSLLIDIATAWRHAHLDQRQRVQTALFPGGLKYDAENGILNPANESVFRQLQFFLAGNTGMARPGAASLNCLAEILRQAKPLYKECRSILNYLDEKDGNAVGLATGLPHDTGKRNVANNDAPSTPPTPFEHRTGYRKRPM